MYKRRFTVLWFLLTILDTTLAVTISSVEEEEIVPLEVLSVVRGKAEIPCDVETVSGDSIQLVLWYKDESTMPIYTYDARGKPVGVAKHWSDESQLGRRAFFRLLTEPATLVLDNVLAEDAGIYRCRVDFRKSKTKNTQVNLAVIVPPQTPKIFDESGREVSDRVGPYEEGQSVKLTCYSTGGKPEPRVEWFQDGRLIDPIPEVVTQVGVIQNVLRLASLRRTDFGSQLSCEASNTNLTLPPRRTVTIDMNLRPLTTKILSSRQPLAAGKKYDIACQAAGSRPPAVITWWKNGEMLKRTKEMIYDDGNMTTSQLTFVPTISDDGKALQCHAENTALTDSSLKDSWIIEVLYPPELVASLGRNLESSDIKEGDDVYFECRVKSKPEPFRLGWKKDGIPLSQNISAGVIISDRSLVLQRITRHAGGLYSCYAANTEGEGVTDQIRLRVKHRPACRLHQQLTYGAAKQLTTLITCSVDSYPAAKHFRWTFNSSDDQINLSESSTPSKDGSSSVLRYTPKTEYDFGPVLCWATNELGTQDEPCVFQVYPAGPPDAPRNCSLINEKSNSMEIECLGSFNGGLEQHFVLEIFDSKTRRSLANLTSSVPRFELVMAGLAQPSTPSYDVMDGFVSESRITPSTAVIPNGMTVLKITAANAQGESDPVYLEAVSLSGMAVEMQTSATSSTPFEFTPTLGALIGLCGTAFILAVGVLAAVMTRITKKPKRRKAETNDLNKEDDIDPEMIKKISETDEKGDLVPHITENPLNLLSGTIVGIKGGDNHQRNFATLPRNEVTLRNNLRRSPIKSVSFSCRPPSGEVQYAELQVLQSPPPTIIDPKKRDTTIYAQIDHSRTLRKVQIANSPVTSPLLPGYRESTT